MSNDTTDDPYDTDYEIGQDNLELFGMDMHNPVFFISAGLILIFVIGALMFPADTKSLLDGAKGWSIENFDWLFIWSANLFVLFCIALVFLPVGKIRIGGIDAVPEFSTL
ncbi:MAG: BCCT family transporter, partial [Candidatus Thiodiazotropha sp. (ex Lucinoma borealis)]|nr:BCCT family transporter [Candidatus Thiodiazotropha sp. (ex Lucinoma borealis)]